MEIRQEDAALLRSMAGPDKPKEKSGCFGGCLTAILLFLLVAGVAVHLVVVWLKNDEINQLEWKVSDLTREVENARNNPLYPLDYEASHPTLSEQELVDFIALSETTWDRALYLLNRLLHPETQTYAEYSALFYQVSDEVIRSYYEGALARRYCPYTDPGILQIFMCNGYCYIEYGIMDGSGRAESIPLFAHRDDDGFRYTLADARTARDVEMILMDLAQEKLGESYIAFLTAKADGRNAMRRGSIEEVTNLPLLKHGTSDLLYAYQKENGDVAVACWIFNGTNHEYKLESARVLMADGGKIVCSTMLQLADPIVIPKVDARLVELIVPAEEVLTGCEPWSDGMVIDVDWP